MTEKNQVWVTYEETNCQELSSGVERRILAFCDEMMCVEHKFKKGQIGELHSHPHTQITYVASGIFEFEIDGVRKVIRTGDTLLKENGVIHGCVCLSDGALLDIFTPLRKDFL